MTGMKGVKFGNDGDSFHKTSISSKIHNIDAEYGITVFMGRIFYKKYSLLR